MIRPVSMQNTNFKGNFRIGKDAADARRISIKTLSSCPDSSRKLISDRLDSFVKVLNENTDEDVTGYVNFENKINAYPNSNELTTLEAYIDSGSEIHPDIRIASDSVRTEDVTKFTQNFHKLYSSVKEEALKFFFD